VSAPLHLMPHAVTLEARSGTARDGSRQHATPVQVRCRAVEKAEQAVDQRASGGTYGHAILSKLTLWCDPAASVAPADRIAYRGTPCEVVMTTEGVRGNGTRVYLKVQCV
jgi:hypothetical protein